MTDSLDAAEDLVIPRMRCAPFHSSLEVAPAGTAGRYDVFLFVEVPLPWDRDISSSEPFASLLGAGTASVTDARGRKVRPQGIVPRPDADGPRRVMIQERPDAGDDPTVLSGTGGPYRRREWCVEPPAVLELCRALVTCDDGAVARFDDRRVDVPAEVVDLFVCTHGKRDACCGGSGAALHDQVAVRLAGPAAEPSSVRLWRTSHTGGHRFAPTALSFPDGYAWAHLDVEPALGVAGRGIDPAQLVANCRGQSSLAAGPAQVADVAALAEVGWSWAGASRTVSVTGFDRRSMATDVRIRGELRDGRQLAFDVGVQLERHVPQITCGLIDGPEYQVEPAWRPTAILPVDLD